MIFNVVTSIQAEEDLRGIFEHIAFELLSPENAEKQLERLEEQILSNESNYEGADLTGDRIPQDRKSRQGL